MDWNEEKLKRHWLRGSSSVKNVEDKDPKKTDILTGTEPGCKCIAWELEGP